MCRTIAKVENALMCSGKFRLPGKKALQQSDTGIEVVLVDATEQPIERPKQRRHYSGKKKQHTQKAQVMIDQTTREIMATTFAQGSVHVNS